MFQKAPSDVIDLITVCFHFNPARRPSAVELLQHVFVSEFHNEEEVGALSLPHMLGSLSNKPYYVTISTYEDCLVFPPHSNVCMHVCMTAYFVFILYICVWVYWVYVCMTV